jgi:hypothetical protein
MADSEVEAVTESARAVQEVARLGGKAIDAGRDAGGWLNRIFGQGVEDLIALHWSDRVKARRIEAAIYDWERLTSLMRKVDARLKAKGVSTLRLLPPKIALALIENATVEHDDDLHTLWANLLATGLDAADDEIHRKYVTILSELTSDDAKILKLLYAAWEKAGNRESLKYWPSGGLEIPYSEASLITLNRLGLVAPANVAIDTYELPTHGHDGRFYHGERHSVEVPGDLCNLQFTSLGEAFCHAVATE